MEPRALNTIAVDLDGVILDSFNEWRAHTTRNLGEYNSPNGETLLYSMHAVAYDDIYELCGGLVDSGMQLEILTYTTDVSRVRIKLSRLPRELLQLFRSAVYYAPKREIAMWYQLKYTAMIDDDILAVQAARQIGVRALHIVRELERIKHAQLS